MDKERDTFYISIVDGKTYSQEQVDRGEDRVWFAAPVPHNWREKLEAEAALMDPPDHDEED